MDQAHAHPNEPDRESRPSRSPSSSRSSSPEPDPMIAVSARLKVLARDAHAGRVPYHDDKSEHYKLFSRAVRNVLSTELALFTFAQIIDGLPIADVAFERRAPGIFGTGGDHPIEGHPELCPGVMERARQIQDDLDLSILMFDPALVRTYRRTTPDSQAFKVRLIELVTVSMHQLAVILFQLEIYMHQGGSQDIERVTNHQEPHIHADLPPYPTRVSLFSHHAYLHHTIYPDGVADVVGYWAEDRILGGVTVFDRPAEENTPLQPPNVYFHSCQDKVTHRYYQLLDEQQQSMVDFFLAEDPTSLPCPLPVLGDKNNLVRVSAVWAVLRRSIYRDVWECPPPTKSKLQYHARRPKGDFNYPESVTLLWSINRQFDETPPRGAQPPPSFEEYCNKFHGENSSKNKKELERNLDSW